MLSQHVDTFLRLLTVFVMNSIFKLTKCNLIANTTAVPCCHLYPLEFHCQTQSLAWNSRMATNGQS